MKAVNILHVVAGMDPKIGGVSQAVLTIIKGLSIQKTNNEVVTLDPPGSNFAIDHSFIIHALGPGKGIWHYCKELLPWLIVNLPRFDKVILHGLWLYHDYAIQKAMCVIKRNDKKQLVPKLFVMPHGMLDPYFQKASGRKLKAYRNWIYWKLFERKTINSAEGLLFTSETERRLAHKAFKPYKPKSEVVVGLGVEAPLKYSDAMQVAFLQKCPDLRNRKYFLFLSRIHEKKGVDILIDAYIELLIKFLDVNIEDKKNDISKQFENIEIRNRLLPRLVIAGPGQETSYGQRIKQLAFSDKRFEEFIFFPGMLTGNAKWGAFYGCQAFILPSHQENFGIAVVEALACSKPVLISNQVNIWPEIIEVGAGFVANNTVDDTRELLENWCTLSTDQKKNVQNAAKALYLDNFSISRAAQRLLDALK